uniref:ShKT domain-containing protein n=1 Tax=Ditylenchus dipsaci TaxID=166011 RepID=A0A915EDX0_9BILA
MFGKDSPTAEATARALVGKAGPVTRPDGTSQSPDPTPYNCDTTDQDIAEDVLKCARHCYLCCRRKKFKCQDADPSFKCDAKRDQCRVPGLIEIMAQKCAGTCGLCDYNGATFCEDHIPQCKDKEFQDMCDSIDPILRNSVRKACPKTCGQCSSNVIGGASISPPAGIPPVVLSRLMSTDCRKTCGYCLPPNTPCQDKNTADCQRWNTNGFCSNTDYPKGMKLLQCPLTCGLCQP